MAKRVLNDAINCRWDVTGNIARDRIWTRVHDCVYDHVTNRVFNRVWSRVSDRVRYHVFNRVSSHVLGRVVGSQMVRSPLLLRWFHI